MSAAGHPAPMPPAVLYAAVATRYAGASRFAQGYVRSKLKRDPATAAILALAAARGGLGEVADLGCGRGQLGLALLLAGVAGRLTGLDRDAGKLAEARLAAAGLPASFVTADLAGADLHPAFAPTADLAGAGSVADLAGAGSIADLATTDRVAPLPPCDTALLVDVLYQLSEPAQLALLAQVAVVTRQRVVIRAFDPARGWRSACGRAMEVVNRSLRGDRAAAIRPLPLAALAAPLQRAGFAVTVAPCWRGTPLPNVLLVAERRAA